MRFSDICRSERPTLSLEFFPPKKDSSLPSTYDLITGLAQLHPDFITVTYGAGGGTRERTRRIVSFVSSELHIPAVAHLTCVGHDQAELATILSELKSEGIEHILALRGDPPKGEVQFTPTENGFENARDLVTFIREHFDFSLAVAGYPETHQEAASPEADIAYLRQKVDAGAEVIITQLFFDASMYFAFVDRARAAGISAPIIPGIMPIANVGQLTRFTDMCGASVPASLHDKLERVQHDKEQLTEFGISFAVDLCRELLDGGAPGIHLYTLNKSRQARPIIEAVFPERLAMSA